MFSFGFVFLSESSGHYIFIERKVRKTKGERFESTLHYQLFHNALLCDLHHLRSIVNASCVAFMDALAAAAPCCATMEAAMATAAAAAVVVVVVLGGRWRRRCLSRIAVRAGKQFERKNGAGSNGIVVGDYGVPSWQQTLRWPGARL